MKRRSGFVSNSSSSSFVILKENLSEGQIQQIVDHSAIASKPMGLYKALEYAEDAWNIRVLGDRVSGATSMDNFSMAEFLQRIGVPDAVVSWGESEYDWSDDEDEK